MRKILLGFAATAASPLRSPLHRLGQRRRYSFFFTVTTRHPGPSDVHREPAQGRSHAQWGNVWKHDYTVTVHSDGNFTGTRRRSRTTAAPISPWAETINGTFTDSATDADTVVRPRQLRHHSRSVAARRSP